MRPATALKYRAVLLVGGGLGRGPQVSSFNLHRSPVGFVVRRGTFAAIVSSMLLCSRAPLRQALLILLRLWLIPRRLTLSKTSLRCHVPRPCRQTWHYAARRTSLQSWPLAADNGQEDVRLPTQTASRPRLSCSAQPSVLLSMPPPAVARR